MLRFNFIVCPCWIAFLILILSTDVGARAPVELRAATQQQEQKMPKSLVPEIQTAEWAVPWWQPRHEAKLKEKAAMKQVDLLLVGDSITHGWEQTGKATFDKYYADRGTLNIGFSGDRTENVLWRLQNGAMDDIQPKVAVVMIGTNNTGHRQDKPEDTAAGVKAILDTILSKSPNTKILLLAIFPRGKDSQDPLRQINESTNAILKKMADSREKAWYLDINQKFLEPDGNLPKSIMPDLLHPNAKGYEIWAAAMEEPLAKLLGEK